MRLCYFLLIFFCLIFHVESCHHVLVLVDKDNSPKWKPSTIEAVSKEKVDSYFETLGDRELVL